MAEPVRPRPLSFPARLAVKLIARTIFHWRIAGGLAIGALCIVAIVLWVTAPPSDPASDTRVAAYWRVYAEAQKLPKRGARCDKLATAFPALTPRDFARNASGYSPVKIGDAAIDEGKRCSEDIRLSDVQFDRLAQAETQARKTPDGPSLDALATIYANFTAFDRERPRFSRDLAIPGAQPYLDLVRQSDARLATMLTASQQLAAAESPTNTIKAAEAADALTSVDIARAAGKDRPALERAQQAATAVEQSRARAAQLVRVFPKITDQTSPADRLAFIKLAAAITPFDRAVADHDGQGAVAAAETLALSTAWAALNRELAALNDTSPPQPYEDIAELYPFLASAEKTQPSAAHAAALTKARDIAAKVSASNTRIATLVAAAKSWQTRRSGGAEILAAYDAITAFDRARLPPPGKAALATLTEAEPILRGPSQGLTANTKAQTKIFVFSSVGSKVDNEVVDSLDDALRSAGFPLASNRADAVLLLDVDVNTVDGPKPDTSGALAQWTVSTGLQATANWAIDRSPLFSDQVVEQATAADRGVVLARALLSCVTALVDRFRTMTGA